MIKDNFSIIRYYWKCQQMVNAINSTALTTDQRRVCIQHTSWETITNAIKTYESMYNPETGAKRDVTRRTSDQGYKRSPRKRHRNYQSDDSQSHRLERRANQNQRSNDSHNASSHNAYNYQSANDSYNRHHSYGRDNYNNRNQNDYNNQ